MSRQMLTLAPLDEEFAVCRLDPRSSLPDWALAGEFFCVTRTAEELSVVCRESNVPADMRCERGWRCFQLRGPFAFSEVGILASVIEPLAAAGISVFAVSTFDTDYVMVKRELEEAAREAWLAAGHAIAPSAGQ